MFEKICGIFKGGRGKNPMLLMTLGQFARKNKSSTQNLKTIGNSMKGH
jgi:hypothetical protein